METLEEMLQARIDGIDRTGGDKPCSEQKHLDAGSDERVYWHHGYASALKDVLRFLQSTRSPIN